MQIKYKVKIEGYKKSDKYFYFIIKCYSIIHILINTFTTSKWIAIPQAEWQDHRV